MSKIFGISKGKGFLRPKQFNDELFALCLQKKNHKRSGFLKHLQRTSDEIPSSQEWGKTDNDLSFKGIGFMNYYCTL